MAVYYFTPNQTEHGRGKGRHRAAVQSNSGSLTTAVVRDFNIISNSALNQMDDDLLKELSEASTNASSMKKSGNHHPSKIHDEVFDSRKRHVGKATRPASPPFAQCRTDRNTPAHTVYTDDFESVINSHLEKQVYNSSFSRKKTALLLENSTQNPVLNHIPYPGYHT
jgi:hypothetical protein